jgi:hypothetical protein
VAILPPSADIRVSLQRVEFKDSSILGDPYRIVEIDLIDGADETDSQRYTSSEWAKDVAKERDTPRSSTAS